MRPRSRSILNAGGDASRALIVQGKSWTCARFSCRWQARDGAFLKINPWDIYPPASRTVRRPAARTKWIVFHWR